jgi:hypothetical protein
MDMYSPVALKSHDALLADQPMRHAGRRATLLHMSGGSIIRYWAAVPPETSSLRSSRTAWTRPALDPSDEPMTRERRSE